MTTQDELATKVENATALKIDDVNVTGEERALIVEALRQLSRQSSPDLLQATAPEQAQQSGS